MGSALRDKSAGGPSAGGEVIVVDVPLTFTGAEVTAASARIVGNTAADFLGLDRADVFPKVTSASSVDLIVTVRVDDIIDSWASSSDTAAWTLSHTTSPGDLEDDERPVVSAEHASTPAEVLHRAVLGLDTECGQKMISGEDDEVPVCDDAVATALTTIMTSINARAELSSSIGATKLLAGDGKVTEHTYDGEDILADDVDVSVGDGVAIKREARRLDPAAGVPRPLQPLAGVEEDGNAAQKHSVDVSGGDDDDDDGDADGDAGGGGGAWVDINGGYGDEGEGEEEEDDDEAASSVVPSSSVAALSRVSLAPLD